MPSQNFSGVKLENLANNKASLKVNMALLCLHLMTNTRYFDDELIGNQIKGLKVVPTMKPTQTFAESESLNLILQLLLYKDKQVTAAVLKFISSNFKQQALLKKTLEFNTFWERLIYAGMRHGLAIPAMEAICSLLHRLLKESTKYEKQLKHIDRLFPKFIIRWINSHSPEQSTFLLDFEEKVNPEVYWTFPMFEKLKTTIGQIFPLDIQNMEEYISGRKKILPKARNPPVTVQIFYELPKELLQVEGLFLNSLIDCSNNYDFSDRRLIPENLMSKSISYLEDRLESKEFASYETTICSHIRILTRTCLKFLRANKANSKEESLGILSLYEKISDHWVKHSTRIAVRGPQINFFFTQTLIDIIKCVILLLPLFQNDGDRLPYIQAVTQKVVQKLLKKLSIDKNKITYLEFKLFKVLLNLQSKLLKSKDQNILQFFARSMNDIASDYDFHLVFGLRLVIENVDLLASTDAVTPAPNQLLEVEHEKPAIIQPITSAVGNTNQAAPQSETQAPQDSSKSNLVPSNTSKGGQDLKETKDKPQDLKPKKNVSQSVPTGQKKDKHIGKREGEIPSADVDSKFSIPVELLDQIKEFSSVKDTLNLAHLTLPVNKSFCLAEITPEVRKKLITFSFYLSEILSDLVSVDLSLPGLVKDGLAFTILELILRICNRFDLDKDDRLRNIAKSYAIIFRKVLAAGSEATIHHFGEENCPVELTIRGSGHEDFAHMLEVFDQETILPLIEFFRVIKNNCHMELVTQAIGGYYSFTNTNYQDFQNEEFVLWLNKQKNVAKPEFVWSSEYAAELSDVLDKQTTSIIHSRKANYSYYIDDFKSNFLANYTRVGDIFLEPLVMAEDYKVSDPVTMLKKVAHPNQDCHRMRQLGKPAAVSSRRSGRIPR